MRAPILGTYRPREIVIRGRGDENVKGRIESPTRLSERGRLCKWELGLSQWARALVSYLAVVSDLNRDSTTMHKLPE